MGRQLKIPGNRTYDTWDLTIINDKNFDIRQDFHEWQNDINNPETNVARSRDQQQFGGFKVVQLNTKGGPLQTYNIHNAWPSVVSDIELNWESNDALETFTVTINYSHWTARDGASPEPGGNEDDASVAETVANYASTIGQAADITRDVVSLFA